MTASPGLRQLAAYSAKVSKKFGEERVSNGRPSVIVSTGSLSLDRALRTGGWQQGRVYEIFGAKDAGKSTLAIASMIEQQRRFPDRGVAYVNMENTFSARRASAMGLYCSDEAIAEGRWVPMLPEHSEHVSDMARELVSSGFMSCVVVDSVGAMESDRVLVRTAEDAIKQMGINARIITQMTKALATHARLRDCTVLLVNQPRAPIGGMAGMPDVSAGPKLLQHATTSKIDMRALGGTEDIRRVKTPGDDEPQVVSGKVRARVARLKNALPGRVAEFYVNRVGTGEFGLPGIDRADECLSVGVSEGVIAQSGGWYVLPGEVKFNGREKAAAAIRADQGLQRAIREAMTFEDPDDDEEDGNVG